jgi:hypothetical protein
MEEAVVDYGFIVATIISCMVWTFLYNPRHPLFIIAQGINLGAVSALALEQGMTLFQSTVISPILAGDMVWIICLILSVLLFFRFVPMVDYLARIPVAYMYALAMGIYVTSRSQVDITNIVLLATKPLVGATPADTITNLFFVISFLCILFYFFFSVRHEGIYAYPSRFGRYVMMLGLGVTLTQFMYSRLYIFQGSITPFLETPYLYVLVVALVLAIADAAGLFRALYKKPTVQVTT